MADEIARLGLALDSRNFRAEGIAAARTLDDIKRSAEGAVSGSNAAAGALQRVVGQMRSMAMLAGIGLGVREIINMADQYKLLEGRLRMVTKGNQDLMNTEVALHQMAQRTRTGYAETAELYTKVARNGAQLGRTNAELMAFTETVQKSIQIGGASAQESSSAVLQLGQALASGVLRGDEFRSIMENASGMAFYLAKGLGVTVGGLRSLAMEGKLTADVVLTGMAKMSKQIDEDFKNVPLTVGHAFTIMRNEVMKWVGETDRAHGSTALLADGLVLLAHNITPVLNGLGAIGALLGVRWLAGGIQSLGAMAAAQATAIAATVAHTQAVAIDAKMNESAAVMTHLRALADEKAATAAFLAATGTEAETAALVALSRASALAAETNAAMVATTEAVVVAEGAATVATGALAGAMGILKGVMAFFGGPIGLAITAIATALYLLYDRYQSVNRARAAAIADQVKENQAIIASNEALRKQTELMDRKLHNIREQQTALNTGGGAALAATVREQGAVDAARAAWDKYKETTSDLKDKALEFDAAVRAGNANALAFLNMTRTTAAESQNLDLSKAYSDSNREMGFAIDAATRLANAKRQEGGVVKDVEARLAAEAKARGLGIEATEEMRKVTVALAMEEYRRSQQGDANAQARSTGKAVAELRGQVAAARDGEAAVTAYNEALAIKNTLEELSGTISRKTRQEIAANIKEQQELARTLTMVSASRDAEQAALDARRMAGATLEGADAVARLNEQLQIEGIQRKYGTNLTAEQVEAMRREIQAIRDRTEAVRNTEYNQRTEELARSTAEINRMTTATLQGAEAVRKLNIELAIEAENRGRAVKMSPEEEARRREELGREADARRRQGQVQKAVDDQKAIWENFLRGIQSGFTDMIEKSLTDGIRGVTGFLELIKRMIIRMFAELVAMRLMQRLFTDRPSVTNVAGGDTPGGGNRTGPFGIFGSDSTRNRWAAGLAGLSAGYGAGQGLYSESHGTFGNNARGVLGGAASGAMAGGMVGGVPGAIIGGLAGIAGGILGIGSAAAAAAKAVTEAVKAVTISMADLRAQVSGDTLAQSIASVEADREQRRKAIEDAWSGGDANSDRVRWRTQQLKEMNALEDQRIAKLKADYAQAKVNYSEDLRVRSLVAQGRNQEADAMRLRLSQEREYREAVANGADAATLALLQQVQAQEKVAAAANNMTAALTNVPNGFKFKLAQFEAMSGVSAAPLGFDSGNYRTPAATPFTPTAPADATGGGWTVTVPVILDGREIATVVGKRFEDMSADQNGGDKKAWVTRGLNFK